MKINKENYDISIYGSLVTRIIPRKHSGMEFDIQISNTNSLWNNTQTSLIDV